MAQRYSESPFDDDEPLTFADLTLLVFLFVATLALCAVLALGAVCADHRIAAAVTAL